uniref:GSCFA domain-containing protein n=1 Tax=Alistipes putredinis TaxID=28117 RepID=UPI003FD791A0
MKFRTEIRIAPLSVRIGYENRLLALGSCFAEHISGRLSGARFRITSNSSGILFNPL